MGLIPTCVGVLAVMSSLGCTRAVPDASPSTTVASAGNPLLMAIRETLAARNPRLNRFAVLDLAIVSPWTEKGYVAIGYGHCDTCPYQNRSRNDELFGVFAINDSLTRIWHTFDVLQTQAGRDWYLGFTSVRGTEIRVQGHSVDYGPAKNFLEKTYAWPNDSYSPRP